MMTIICLNYFDTLSKVWSDKIFSLLQTKYDNVCRTETRTEYKTEYDQKCETRYETKCEIMYETVYEEVCDTPPVDDEYGSPAAPVLDTYGSPRAPVVPPVEVRQRRERQDVRMTKYFVMKDGYGSPKAPPVSCRQVPKQQEKEKCTQVDIPAIL